METEPVKTVKTVLHVETDFETSLYTVKADKGTSVNEMAFATMVVIRTLIKNGYLKNRHEFIQLVHKYFNDPQYEEVTFDKESEDAGNEVNSNSDDNTERTANS